MAKAFINTKGLEDLVMTLQRVSDRSEEIIDKAIEEGAGIVADAVRAEINALPVGKEYGHPSEKRNTVYPEEKASLSSSFGISKPMTLDGSRNVKVGFGGYNKDGKANILIARSLNSGTSFSKKFGFFNRGVRKSKAAATQKVEETLREEIRKITKG